MNASIAKRIAPLLMGSAILGASLASHAASPCESAQLKAWFESQRAMTDGDNPLLRVKELPKCPDARSDKTAASGQTAPAREMTDGDNPLAPARESKAGDSKAESSALTATR